MYPTPSHFKEENLQGQFFPTYSQIFSKRKEKSQPTPLYSKTGHWSDKQNTKYYAFLKRFKEQFSEREMRRECKIFKTLAEFVKTRNANQCRSHHHKMQKDFKTVEETLAYLQLRVPEIEPKSQKYKENLEKIIFTSSYTPEVKNTEIPVQKQIYPQIQNKIEENLFKQPIPTNKASLIPFLKTGLSYDDPDVKQENLEQQQGNLKDLQREKAQLEQNQEIRRRQEKINECYEYFIQWWTKLNQLIQLSEERKKESNDS